MNYNDYPRRNPPPQHNQMPSYQQNYRRQPPKRRITGRFYAFSCVALVLVVMLGVFVRSKIAASRPVEYYKPTIAGTPTAETTPTQTPVVDLGQVPTGNDGAQAEAQPQVEPEPTADPNGWLDAPVTQGEVIDSIAGGNDLNARTDLPKEWRNILLLGSDTRDMKKSSRSDTIIIASINSTTGQVKLTSIMRDTTIEIPGKGLRKINDASPKVLMKLINENLGMNITEYVLVNFAGLARVIDELGGIYLDITKEEMAEINTHMGEVAAYTMSKDEYLAQRDALRQTNYGTSILVNGIQAVTFARIRIIDTDFRRTERQREVLDAILKRVKNAGVGQLFASATSMWGQFETNIDMLGAVGLAKTVLSAGLADLSKKENNWRIPGDETATTKNNGSLGYGFYDVDYPELTRRLHRFIYGNEFT